MPVSWYKFWNPHSGAPGGAICGLLIFAVCKTIF